MAEISPNVSSPVYTANGIVTAFTFPFSVVSETDVLVLWNGAPHATGYNVTFGDLAGTVTFQTPPPNGTKIQILLDPDYLQTSEFADQGSYNLSTVNAINRRAVIKDLVNKDKADRALKVPLGEPSITLPSAEDRSETLLGFDAGGESRVYAISTGSLEILASIADQIGKVANNETNINTAANNTTNISTVATSIGNVNLVGPSISSVVTAAGGISNIGTVAGSIANVNLVGGSITNVNLVGPNITALTTVAANIGSLVVAANDRLLLDGLNRLVITGSETRIGYQGIPGTNSNLSNNTLAYVGTSDIIQALSNLSTEIITLNSGATDLIIMTGTQAAPIYKSMVSLPAASAIGTKTWTSADFGAINLAVGDMVWINAPIATGIVQSQTTIAGNTLRYVLGPATFSAGASPGTISTSANKQLRAWFNTPSKDLSLDAAHMTPAVQAKLGVVDLITGIGSLKGGYTGSLATATGFGGPNLLFYVATAMAAATMTALELYINALGSGAATLVIATGDPVAPVYKTVTALPAANSIGIKQWTAADFGAINLAIGDHIFLHIPTGGITLAQVAVPGRTVYYKTGVPAPTMPGGATGLAAQANSQIVARFRYAGIAPALTDEYLSASVQAKLALLSDISPATFRIFVGVGQSNIVGLGDAGLSPSIPAGRAFQFYNGSLTPILGDTIGNATAGAGTIWPSFINEFYRRSGEGVVVVPAAVGATGLAGGGVGNNWSPSSSLRNAAITALNAAIAACNAAGVLWSFGGFIWGQGEADADQIAVGGTAYAGGTLTAAMHETALAALVTYFQGQMTANNICLASEMPFIIQKLGTRNTVNATYDAAYASIQQAQVNVSRTFVNVSMGYQGAPSFRARGLMRDTYHYLQQGYSECGMGNATAAAHVCIGLA